MSDAKNFKRGLQGVLQVPDPSKASQRMTSLYGSCFPHRAVSRANKHLLAGQSQPHESTQEKKKKKKHPTFIPKGKKEDYKRANRILKIQIPEGRNVMIY